MKILCFTDNLASGGAQRQLTNLACELKKRGHKVEMAVYYPQRAPQFDQMLNDEEISVNVFAKQSRFSLMPVWKLWKYVNTNAFDVVIAFQETPSFYAEVASLGWKHSKLIASERNSMFNQAQTKKMYVLRQFHRFADKVTTNSFYHAEFLQSQFSWLCNKLFTIYNGVDLSIFKPTKAIAENDDTIRLLAIGRISKQKNPITLANALAICRNELHLQVTITWVGEVNVDADFYNRALINSVSNNNLSDLWQRIDHVENIPVLFNQYDALILPSFFEGLPNVVCEALASGLPVLLSNVCDHPKLVQSYKTGYLFDPNDAHDIAHKIKQFCDISKREREEMGVAARKFAETTLDMQRMVTAYEDLMISLDADANNSEE